MSAKLTREKVSFINQPIKIVLIVLCPNCNANTYPLYERQAKLLEGVQRRATKLIPNLKEMNYNERLKVLKLPSLQYRRVRGDIIEAYKYLHKIYDVSPCPLTLDDNPVSTRGNSLKLKKPRYNKSVTQKFFTHRVVDPWNRLPDHVVLAPTLNTLKNRLDVHWRNRMSGADLGIL